ncbi:MAG: GTP-binding protein [Nitrososphaerales archaeon]
MTHPYLVSIVAQIAGFLGSGKTTTLISLGKELSTNHGKKVSIIVNEVGEVGIDGSFIRDFGFEVREIVQGCICCSLQGDLQSTLKILIENFSPDVVLIEPTGIAFPSKIREIVDGLADISIEQAPVVALVDGSRFRSMFKEMEHFLIKQIKEADIVAMNKTDLIESKWETELLRSAVRELNPSAYIFNMSAKRGDGMNELIDIILQGGMKGLPLMVDENSIMLSGMGWAALKILFKTNEDVSGTKIKVIISDMLNGIANASLKSGSGLIGHIKAYLKTPAGSLKASILEVKHEVDFSGDLRGSVREGEMRIYAAVKDLEDELVRSISENGTKKILSRNSLDFRVEDEHD